MTRIILITGKGGTGKTTCAAATALKCAELGYKTLAISSDPAHSLADSLDVSKREEIIEITPYFSILEINAQKEMDKEWKDIQEYLTNFFALRGIDEILAGEMVTFPGADELFCILKIEDYKDEFDVIVLDTAPTGHTIRMIAFPEAIGTMGRRLMKVDKFILKILRPFQRLLSSPLPESELYNQTESLLDKVLDVKAILQDSESCTCRFVTNLEKLPMIETIRSLTFMNLFGILVDAVIVNKIIPDTVSDPYFQHWKEIQSQHMQKINNAFDPIPIFKIPLYPNEIIGIDSLKIMGNQIYGNKDPTEKFFDEKPFLIWGENDNLIISIKFPFSQKGDFDMTQDNDELIIRVGDYKRIIYLPSIALNYEITHAKFTQKNELQIIFQKVKE